ncbi:MAG: ATP synthase subunit I [Nitrospiraceae bacterium]|nr:MAG: ATP synthase subunit I [Nitrospiraceae bacterium]
MIEPMTKVRLVFPRTLVDRVTALLQDAGVLHIESAPAEAAQIPLRSQVIDETTRDLQTELERLHEELRRLLVLLPEASPAALRTPPSVADRRVAGSGERRPEDWKRIAQIVRQIGSRVDYLTGRLKVCEDELALLSKYERAIEALAPFLRLMKESDELDHLGVTIEEEERHPRVLPLLHEMMAKVTDNRYELLHSRLDERTLAVLLVFPRTHAARIRGLLWEEGINELRLPASVSDKPLAQALRVILKKKVDLPLRAARYREQLTAVARTWREDLLRYRDAVVHRLRQIEAVASFYQTELASLIYGWVPSRALGTLRDRLFKEFGGKVVLEACPIHRAEWATVPVILHNPPWLKPFESLTRLIALPRYGSIDPTPYLAVFFPLFYGMILGDIGYGVLVLIAATVTRHRYGRHPMVRDLTFVLAVASVAAVLFGVLFGELFGELGEYVGLHPILDRMEAFIPLLYLSIGIGAGHVCLGILLGAFGAWRQGDRHECLAKLGGFGLVVSFVVVIGGLSGLFPRLWVKAASAGLAASLAMTLVFGGARGALEVHNLVNVLSYLRLMGIGVASAALAFAANKLGGLVGNILLAIMIGVTLHAINLVFGLLSPTIQSLRLHYVEFFENFFAPGGRPYSPFKRGTSG